MFKKQTKRQKGDFVLFNFLLHRPSDAWDRLKDLFFFIKEKENKAYVCSVMLWSL